MANTTAPKPQTAYGIIPNLINGVSQQPANIRFSSQGDECVNCFPNIEEQLARRNPLETLFKLSGVTIDSDSYVHTYRRDANEAYHLIFNGTTIQVVSLTDGSTKTVTMSQPGGDTYHQSADPKANLFAYTLKDTTFIVNRAITAAMQSDLSTARDKECLIVVKQASTDYNYSGTLWIGSNSHTYNYTAVAGDSINTVATNIESDITTFVTTNGGSITKKANVVWVSHPTDTIKVSFQDNRAGTALVAFTNELQKDADLPFYAPDGYLVTIVGSTSSQNGQDQNETDDVVYRFDTSADETMGQGVWKEDIASGLKYVIDPTTMPHKLTRQSDGTFLYEAVTWDNRTVGNDITNPIPPFIDSTINSCFVASNRFGLCFGGYAMLSRVDEPNYFNFWKTTTRTSLDTDPVIIPLASSEVVTVYWANQWDGELMLFADNLEGSVSWQTSLAPNKITINAPTNYGSSATLQPRIIGQNIFMVKNQGDYSLLYQYHIDPISGKKTADHLTDYVAAYIPANVTRLDYYKEDFLALLSSDDRSKLYCLNYSIRNNRFVQQAVHHWEFPSDVTIYEIFIDSYNGAGVMYVLYGLGGNVFIGKILLNPAEKDTNFLRKCFMDLRITEAFSGTSLTYDAATDTTALTLPYSFGSSSVIVELREAYSSANGDYPVGELPAIKSQVGTTVTLFGDLSGAKLYIGVAFSSYYDPYQFQAYIPNPDGTGLVADPWKEIKLHKLVLQYANTGFFKVQALNRRTGAVVHTKEFNRQMDAQKTIWDAYQLYTGKQLISFRQPLENFKVRLLNDSTRPSYFTTLGWIGEYIDGSQ